MIFSRTGSSFTQIPYAHSDGLPYKSMDMSTLLLCMSGHSVHFPTPEQPAHQLVRPLTIPAIFVSYRLINMSLQQGEFDPEGENLPTNPIGILPLPGSVIQAYVEAGSHGRTFTPPRDFYPLVHHYESKISRFASHRECKSKVQTFYSTIRLLYQQIV